MAKIKDNGSVRKRVNNFWWPEITDLKTAKHVAYYGIWAALVNAGLTTFFVVLGLFGVRIVEIDFLAMIDVVIFLLIAFGIYKLNKIAAVAGLLFYILEVLLSISSNGFSFGFMRIFLVFLYINAVRGTFIYHKLLKMGVKT